MALADVNPCDDCHSQDTARSPGAGGRALPAAGLKGHEVFTPHAAAGPSCCSTFDCPVTGHRVEKFLEKSVAAWAVFVCRAQTWPELFVLRTGGHWPQLPGNGAGLALQDEKRG